MKYKLSAVIIPLSEGGFLARCERVRATATGDTCDEAVRNLREAVEDLVREYGEASVFQEISPDSEVQVIEVAL
jgi:predicted RNase H-like HicB family nuclease